MERSGIYLIFKFNQRHRTFRQASSQQIFLILLSCYQHFRRILASIIVESHFYLIRQKFWTLVEWHGLSESLTAATSTYMEEASTVFSIIMRIVVQKKAKWHAKDGSSTCRTPEEIWIYNIYTVGAKEIISSSRSSFLRKVWIEQNLINRLC